MKEVNYMEDESARVICECGNTTFKRIIYDENFCEAGPCLRLLCSNCTYELDFSLGYDKEKIEQGLRMFQKREKKFKKSVMKE